MRYLFLFLVVLFLASCTKEEKSHQFNSVTVKTLYVDSVSIRALEIMDYSVAFAGSNGIYGQVNLDTDIVKTNTQLYDTIIPQYRAVAHTNSHFFMLSVASPALLYKTGDEGSMELVYREEGDGVFYDAMKFWNDQEGIAVGDSMNGCLSIIITRDGGDTWEKLACTNLPKATEGEGAFAASNTNIEIKGNNTWIATTSSRIYFSADKGLSWEIFNTPVIQKGAAEGIYSIDFYNENLGVVIGGDYTAPEKKHANKAITLDGGKTWQLIANEMSPGYKSCIQFVPHSGGQDMVAIGLTGISYSNNKGASWKTLSDESFYTLQFINDSIAYAAGKNRVAKLVFK